ncbi:MAG TPA: Uma2 family endonuclease [Thermoanaerobaculia bacterium]|jgi:Uma2 family endonuclease|nr:Uma2 family endonuclease [Thermoanaerobaculia bacterium]
MAVAEIEQHLWTRKDYERMVAKGLFEPGAKVELVEGVIYDMAAHGSVHATGVRLMEKALQRIFSSGFDVRGQMPLALGRDSEPEPDVAVVPGDALDYTRAHPTNAVLVVEVADKSLGHDRQRKLPLYARSGIPEAWILNLRERTLEVYREPSEGLYRSRVSLVDEDTISPLARPDAVIPVSELMP